MEGVKVVSGQPYETEEPQNDHESNDQLRTVTG
jgi:hypothetical protein